jgi:hypothetical protein
MREYTGFLVSVLQTNSFSWMAASLFLFLLFVAALQEEMLLCKTFSFKNCSQKVETFQRYILVN